ncbi:MAG: acetate--CoA ligase family protein, partial [Gemmatimonadota bacterium]
MEHPLEPILHPSSVAVVGVSADPRKRGHQAMRALLESGYAGAVYPVHPKGGTHFGRVAARTVLEIDAVPDHALVCTPAAGVLAVLERCAQKGVRGAVVLAAGVPGLSEEGAPLDSGIREIARRTGLRVVGPNTSGILRPSIGLNLVGARGVPPGRLAILAQSGNVALAVMNEAVAKTGLGVSLYIGVGNEADLAFHEYLDYLETDSETGAVVMYVEGLREGRAFLETARRVGRTKPLVVLKGGRSPVGGAAVRTHTGALAGSAAVFRAAMRQAGVIEVRRSDELFQVCRALAEQPSLSPEGGVAVLSDGGGHAILAADALAEAGVPLADLSAETRARLRDLLGRAAAVGNPLDLAGAGDRDPGIFARAHEALLGDPAVGAVVVVGLFGGYAIRFDPELAGAEIRAAETMAAQAAAHRKAWVVHSLYA